MNVFPILLTGPVGAGLVPALCGLSLCSLTTPFKDPLADFGTVGCTCCRGIMNTLAGHRLRPFWDGPIAAGLEPSTFG